MRNVKLGILGLIAVILVIVLLANSAPVTLRLLPETMAGFLGLTWTVTLPMFIVVLAAVAVGVLIGFVWEWSREHKHRAAARSERREKEQLRRDMTTKRSGQRQRGDDILALLEDGSTPRA